MYIRRSDGRLTSLITSFLLLGVSPPCALVLPQTNGDQTSLGVWCNRHRCQPCDPDAPTSFLILHCLFDPAPVDRWGRGSCGGPGSTDKRVVPLPERVDSPCVLAGLNQTSGARLFVKQYHVDRCQCLSQGGWVAYKRAYFVVF